MTEYIQKKIFRDMNLKIYGQAGLLLMFMLPLLLGTCTTTDEQKLGLLPSAKGDSGEIILVMDSTKWNGKLGDAVKDVFRDRVPGLPQPEAMFTVRQVEPSKFQNYLRHHKNVVLVTTFDSKTAGSRYLKQFFTEQSIQQIKNDTSLYMNNTRNQFARGQIVMNLFSEDEETLIRHLNANKHKIQDILNETERKRLVSRFNKARKKELEASIASRHDFGITLPDGYRLAKDSANFVWLRFPEYDFDKNLIITYKDYTSEQDFDLENIIEWRNKIAREHTKDPDNPNYYVTTETLVPVSERKVSLDGNYAVEARGLWRLKDRFVGGPFVSYTFVDQESNRMYYIEGFISAPGSQKREFMREIEAILHSFKG